MFARPALPGCLAVRVCVCTSVCASTCGSINRPRSSHPCSTFFAPCLLRRRFVPNSLSEVAIGYISFLSLSFFLRLVNIPIFTCTCSFSPPSMAPPGRIHKCVPPYKCIIFFLFLVARRWMERRAERKQRRRRQGKRTGSGVGRGGGRLITVAGLVAWRRRGPGMPGCLATSAMQ